MSNGYQKFFRAAQAAKRGERPEVPPSREARLRQAVGTKRRRARQPFPLKAALGFAACLALGGAYLCAPDWFEQTLERIEVNAIGGARASEGPAEKSKPKAPAAEKAAAPVKDAKHETAKTKDAPADEDVSQYEKLKARKEELDHREKELAELEEELQRQKGELDQRIQQLEKTRDQIAQILKERVEIDQEKVTKLVDLYSNMKAKQAADVIGSMNEDLAVEVLAKMKKKNAAEIMNLLTPDKARTLSEKYTGFRRAHPETDASKKG